MRGDDTDKTPFKLNNITLSMASGDQHIAIQEDQRGALSILADLVMYDGKKSLTYDTGKFRRAKMCYDVWLHSFSFLFKIDNDVHDTALEYLGNVAACLMIRKFYSSKVYDVSRFVLTPLYFGHLDIVENMIAINPRYLLQNGIPRNIFNEPIRNDSNPVTPFQAVIMKGDIEFLLKIRKYLSGIDEEKQFREILVRALKNRLDELKNNCVKKSGNIKEEIKSIEALRKNKTNTISELFRVYDESLKTKAENNTLIKELFKAINSATKKEIGETIDLLNIDSSPLAMDLSQNAKRHLSEKIRIFYNEYTRLIMSDLIFNPYYCLSKDDYSLLSSIVMQGEKLHLKTIIVSFIESFAPASYKSSHCTYQHDATVHQQAWKIYAEISGGTFNVSRLIVDNGFHPIVRKTLAQGLLKLIVKPEDDALKDHIFTIIKSKNDLDGILNWISQKEGSTLIEKLESMAVKKFFDCYNIEQNKRWKNKQIDKITLRNIIDYIISIGPFGFFRSPESETEIKKQLEMFGVNIGDLRKLDPEKQCRYFLEQINWPENQPVKKTAITPRVR